MAKRKFKITRFRNPSGQFVHRVSGTLNGERIRKNFETRNEAVAFRQKLEIKRLNEASKGQTIWTTLSHEDNREAIASTNLLKAAESKRSLTFAVKYFLEHYKEVAEEMSVSKAINEYVLEKQIELERGIITSRQLRAIKIEMQKLCDFFPERIVGELQTVEIKEFLDAPPRYQNKNRKPPLTLSLKTWNNRRGYLSTFFKFCHSKKFVGENPILEIPQYKIKKARGTAETLSAKQAVELMSFLEDYRGNQNKDGGWWGEKGCLVPYFALALFAGVRPDYKDGEITKLSLNSIRLDTNVIYIEPTVSKVNEKRTIKIQPNLRLWLEKYPPEKFPIIPKRRFRDLWVEVRKHFKLPHDVLRHTFISMTVGAFRSIGDAALQAGNSEQVIRKHYLDLKSVAEADEFWKIIPKGPTIPPNLVKQDGCFQRAKLQAI